MKIFGGRKPAHLWQKEIRDKTCFHVYEEGLKVCSEPTRLMKECVISEVADQNLRTII